MNVTDKDNVDLLSDMVDDGSLKHPKDVTYTFTIPAWEIHAARQYPEIHNRLCKARYEVDAIETDLRNIYDLDKQVMSATCKMGELK